MKRNYNDDAASNDAGENDYSKSQHSDMAMQATQGNDADGSFSVLDYSANSPDHSSTDSGSLVTGRSSNYSRQAATNRTSFSQKCLEDEERKKIRRERNKMAAAKCRQKRVDQTNMLLEETQKLECQQKMLKEDIRNFEKQKDELEYIMQSHLMHCQMDSANTNMSNNKNNVNTNCNNNNLNPNVVNINSNINENYNNSATSGIIMYNNHSNSNIPNNISNNMVKSEQASNGGMSDETSKELNSTPLLLKSENGKQYLVTCNNQQQQLHRHLQQQQQLHMDQFRESLEKQPISLVNNNGVTPVKHEQNDKNNNILNPLVTSETASSKSSEENDPINANNYIKSQPMTVVRPNQLPSFSRPPLIYSNHYNNISNNNNNNNNNNNINNNNAPPPLNTPCMAIGLESLIENTGLTPVSDNPLFHGNKTPHVLITPVIALPPDAMLLNNNNNNNIYNKKNNGSNNDKTNINAIIGKDNESGHAKLNTLSANQRINVEGAGKNDGSEKVVEKDRMDELKDEVSRESGGVTKDGGGVREDGKVVGGETLLKNTLTATTPPLPPLTPLSPAACYGSVGGFKSDEQERVSRGGGDDDVRSNDELSKAENVDKDLSKYDKEVDKNNNNFTDDTKTSESSSTPFTTSYSSPSTTTPTSSTTVKPLQTTTTTTIPSTTSPPS